MPQGPYGDHTGYYNEQDWLPVFTIDRITQKREPIDYLDFASPVSGLGSKMGIDATNKRPRETRSGRRWAYSPQEALRQSARLA